MRSRPFLDVEDEETCDVQFVCEGGRVLGHSQILSMASPVFRVMFSAQWKQEVVEVPDARVQDMRALVHYVYGKGVRLEVASVLRILRLAEKYDMPDLKEECEAFASAGAMSVDSVCEMLQMARLLDAQELALACFEFAERHAGQVLAHSEGARHLDAETLVGLLQSDHLEVREFQLYRHVAQWVRLRGGESGGVFEAVRFPLMSLRELVEVDEEGLVPPHLLKEAYRNHASRASREHAELAVENSRSSPRSSPHRRQRVISETPLRFVRGGPGVELEGGEEGERRWAQATRDGWSTVLTDGVFDGTGMHAFSFKVARSKVCFIMVGLCSPSASDLSKGIHEAGNAGYAVYLSVGQAYHDGKQLEVASFNPRGETFAQGDTITLLFSGSKGTLAFLKNGTKLGVAFRGLSNMELVPAVSFIERGDRVSV